jgi:hypothetical protein
MVSGFNTTQPLISLLEGLQRYLVVCITYSFLALQSFYSQIWELYFFMPSVICVFIDPILHLFFFKGEELIYLMKCKESNETCVTMFFPFLYCGEGHLLTGSIHSYHTLSIHWS